ncbi:MAG: tyrosine-type recombinase/integrase, partial [Desulfovibrionaceae bacterium]|nr:tyrosine-type recombinase/integrase [Desulfovibrionaceae bacterium]
NRMVSPQARLLMQLLPVIPGIRQHALRSLTWQDVDLEAGIVTVAARDGNKTREGYVIPLPRRSLELLRRYAKLQLDDVYCFPSANETNKAGYLSDAALYSITCHAGIEGHCLHGWRTAMKTLAVEHGVPLLLTDLALGHKVERSSDAVYNRSNFLESLRILYQWWEDFLISLRDGQPVSEWPGISSM